MIQNEYIGTEHKWREVNLRCCGDAGDTEFSAVSFALCHVVLCCVVVVYMGYINLIDLYVEVVDEVSL